MRTQFKMVMNYHTLPDDGPLGLKKNEKTRIHYFTERIEQIETVELTKLQAESWTFA